MADPKPDFSGALAAGYSPTEILNAYKAKKGSPDIDGARQAGYSDDELLHAIAGPVVAPSASPVAPSTPPPDGSLSNALYQGLVHGAPAGVASGLAGFGRFANRIAGSEDTGHVSDALDAYAARQQQAMADNYQAPADAPKSVADAVAGSSGVLGAAARIGQYGLRKAAENAGTIAPNLALGLVAPESLGIKGGLLAYDYLQNLAGVRAAKQAAGADPNQVSIGDMANAGGQTALMGATPLGAGIAGKGLAAAGGRVLANTADGALKGGIQSIANDTGAVLQGGHLGTDPVSTMAAIGSHALDGAAAGAVVAPGIAAGREGAASVGNYLTTRKAGPNMQAFAAETGPWNDAVASATQRIQQASPGLSPDEVQQRAYVLAQQGTPGNPGVAPPSFDKLSPAAQNGMAELATVQMYQKARQAITDGMGRPDADPAPAQVFKNVLATVTDNLTDTANLAQKAGVLSRDDAGTLKDAIAEARKHNVLSGENGSQFGWFDTLRDQVGALQMDPVLKNQVLQQLRVADIASQASLYKNSKGPLERNAGTILPMLGAGASMLTHGATFSPFEGGMAGRLFQAQGTAGLRALDGIMGNGLPDILQRQGAIEKFAQDNGLSSVADPMALQQMNADLRGLGQQPPMGPRMPMPPQGPPGASPGPVTASGSPYTGQAPQGPVASPQTPQSAPSPVPPQAAPMAPQRPPVAPGVIAPVTAADRLAMAPKLPQAQAAPQASPITARPDLVQATASVNDALQARAARLAQAAQAAFPSDRRGWSASMADTLGVQHAPMMDALKTIASANPELAQSLQGSTIPLEVLRAMTNHLADLRDAGQLPRVDQPAVPDQSGVRNPLSYAANLEQERATAEGIVAARPDLVHAVAAIRDPASNGKTAAGRKAVLERYLAALSPQDRAAQETILRPLTGYGSK